MMMRHSGLAALFITIGICAWGSSAPASTCTDLFSPEFTPSATATTGKCRIPCIGIPVFEECLKNISLPHALPAQFLKNRLKVLVWNIFKGQKSWFKSEFQSLAEKADLILTQEAYLAPPQATYFQNFREFSWDFGISFLMTGDIPTGVMTGARTSASSISLYRSRDLEPWSNSPKVSLATTYLLTNQSHLLVINLHGINFRSTAALERQLRDLTPQILAHEGPVILAGDFNTHMPSRQTLLDRISREWGLVSVPWQNKMNGPWPAVSQLDHVFTRGLVIHGARFLAGFEGSDHAPIWIEIETP